MSNDLAARKAALTQSISTLRNTAVDDDANFKFMNLLRSRLVDEGIPVEAATRIVVNLDYDLSAASEEDDYLAQVALQYAEYAGKVYSRLALTNWHRHMTDAMICKYFSPIRLSL